MAGSLVLRQAMTRSSPLQTQVVVTHGRATPFFPLRPMRRWLELLPDKELLRELDRSTVVLPRPGDGWYAPPTSSTAGADVPPAGWPIEARECRLRPSTYGARESDLFITGSDMKRRP